MMTKNAVLGARLNEKQQFIEQQAWYLHQQKQEWGPPQDP
jgi:hypothetical protein